MTHEQENSNESLIGVKLSDGFIFVSKFNSQCLTVISVFENHVGPYESYETMHYTLVSDQGSGTATRAAK